MRKTNYFLFLFLSAFGYSQNIIWQKSFGSIKDEFSYAIQAASTGGFVIAGSTESPTNPTFNGTKGMNDFFLVKTGDNGNQSYNQSFGGTMNDEITSIVEYSNNIVMAGASTSSDMDVTANHGEMDAWIVNFYNGSIAWRNNYGGSHYDRISSLKRTVDGGFVFAGATESTDGDLSFKTTSVTDGWIVKLNSTGGIVWQKVLAAIPDVNQSTTANAVEPTTDGGYIIAGNGVRTFEERTDLQLWVAKLDSAGNTEWSKVYDGDDDDEATSVLQTSDGGYIIAGYTKTTNNLGDIPTATPGIKYWILKLDASGNTTWSKTYSGSLSNFARSIIQTADGGYIVAGDSYSDAENYEGSRDYDYYVIKIDSSGNVQWQKKYGGSGLDRAFSIIQAPDGNYVVTGYSDSTDGDITSNNGGFDIWTIKINGN